MGAALRSGFRTAFRTRSAVWVLLLVNLGVAALAALPIYRGILGSTGSSLMGQTIARAFPRDWLVDFSINSPGSLDRYAGVITLLGLLTIPVNSILAAGVIGRFRAPASTFSLREFYRDTAAYAWRFLRLMAIGLVCYWFWFLVVNQGLGGFVRWLTRDWLDDRPVFWMRLGVDLLLLVGLVFVNLVMDFARVKLVLDDGSSAVEAFLASLGFSLGCFWKAVSVYAIPSLCGVALLAIYWLLVPWPLISRYLAELHGPQWHEPLTLALLFLGQQLVTFGRYWFRVATWASEWSFFSGPR